MTLTPQTHFIKGISAAVLTCCITLLFSGAALAQTTFTVNSTEDNSNETVGNGDCDTGETIDINGDSLIECTFRAALEEVNAGSGEFEIEFSDNIDTDANGRSIVEGVEEPLPEVNSQLTVAGETHPEFDGQHPKFALIAQADESTNDGLRITSGADNSSIRHIGIGLFENSGIVVANVSNVELEGVESGYSVGLFSFGNSDHGIVIGSSAENTVVTESTIIWNDGWGIRVTGAATGTRITDNHIGIKDDNGDYDILGNEDGGVLIHPNASDDNRVGNCYQLIGTATCDGNTISGNDGPGVDVQSDNQRVVANNIGTDPDGNGGEDFANEGNGIDVSSSNNTIGQSFIGGVIGSSVPGQNVVGNNTYGVLVNGSGNTIHNNYLGTNEDFDDVGNQLNGILISSGADNHITDNEIRFNDDDGVNLSSDSNQGDITGNRIKSNEESGIHIVNGAAEIGSTDDPNIIGNNDDHGISVRGSIDDVKILGNYIGTNEEGDNLGNDRNGINVGSGISSTSANSVEIGNTASINDDSDDAANVIGFNQSGVRLIYTNDQTIQGNYIGTNADGEDLGNNAHGVYIGDLNPAQGNVVGYSAGDVVPDNTHPSEGSRANVISNNSDAVNLFENDGENKIENPVRGNIISGNEDGINLGDEGDEIDPGGGEEGPNNLQNFPEFDEDETVYNDTDDEIIANFRVRTNTGNAAYPLEIDFYKVDGDEQQGKTYLGTVDYSDANDWVFETIDLPDHVDLSSGEHIVATATDGDGNTSQFSEVVAVQEEVPEIAVSEDELDFNTVIEGESETRTFDIENTGDDDLDGEVSLEEDGGGVFDITGGDGSFSLSPNDDMEVEVEFTPDDVDDFAGRIDVEHNADNEPDPFEVDLEGEGIEEPEPLISVSEDELDFNTVIEGESETRTFDIENTGDDDLDGEVSLEEDGGGVFDITGGDGSFSLSPNDDMEVEVEFTPDDVDDFAGRIDVEHNADNEPDPFEVDLEGEGIEEPEPLISVSEDELDFDTVIEGESETRTFDIENTGDDDLDGEVSLEEDGGGVFDITGGDGSFSLSPNDDMEVEVEFTPDDVDDFAGRIDVEHNADNEPDPFEVDLEGEGQPDIPAPDAVSLSSPEDEAENVVVSPDFEWLEAEYADEYLLQVAEDSDFDEYQIDESVTDTTYTPDSELDYYQTYYWRVRASNDSGDGEWSESWSFTTEPNIEPFALESPADESEVTVDGTPDDEFLIEWEYPESVVEDELTFVWILSEDGSFDNPELEIQSDNDGEDTTLTLTYQELDDFLDSNGISEGEEFEGQWTVRAEYEQTDQEAEEPFEVTLVRGEVTSSQEIGEVPDDFTLKQNYPNPFNPSTQIRFELPEDAEVTLRVYNSVGREVTTLIDESKSAGSYEVTFNANDLSSGNYIYRLEANDQILTRTMTFVK